MLDDLRTVSRRLLRAPGFAASAIGIIAFAIGANAGIFAVADAVLFRPLPYDHPDDIYILRIADPRNPTVPFEYIQALAAHRGIAAIGMRGTQSVAASQGSDAQWFSSISATPAYFRVLGVRPARGRLIDSRDTGDWERVAMLSYGCWQRRFGGDPQIIGRSFTVGSRSKQIVGVLPRGFVFPTAFVTWPSRFGEIGSPDYVTAAREPVFTGNPRSLFPIAIGGRTQDPVIRLKPGVKREQAQIEVDALTAPLRAANPRLKTVRPILQDVRSLVFPTGRRIMALLLAAAGLVLLLGCSNLAVMLLARTRRAEARFGIQLALGATRSRIVRPVLIEAIVIGVVGGVAGLLVASATFGAMLRQVPPAAYGTASVGVDLRTALFAMCLAVASGVLFGVLPAWRASRLDVQALIRGRSSDRPRRRGRFLARPLVAVQVAFATVLLFAAVVAGRALVDVLRVPLGFDPQNVATFYVEPPRESGLSMSGFYERALEALRQRPDVIAAGAAYSLPFGTSSTATISDDRRVAIDWFLPGYFEATGTPLVAGRLPTSGEVRAGAKVAVMSQAAGRVLFPGLDPVGRRMRVDGADVSVIGVVGDVRRTLDAQSVYGRLPNAYILPPDRKAQMLLVARMRTRSPHVVEEMRADLRKLSPGEPVVAGWWSDSIDALMPFRAPRFQTLILGTFAALAVALTALGIFAVVSFMVASRTREMGVRMALGASPRSLVGVVVRQAMVPVAGGILVGLTAARWLDSIVQAQLFGVQAGGTVTMLAAGAVVVVVAFGAAYLPARQVSRVDPSEVLRAP